MIYQSLILLKEHQDYSKQQQEVAMADTSVECLAMRACNDKLCKAFKQAKDTLCRQFYAKKLLSGSLHSKCNDSGVVTEKFVMEMVDALEKRVENDSKAYYTILDVLTNTSGMDYLKDILEEEKIAIQNRLEDKQKSTEEKVEEENISHSEEGKLMKDENSKRVSSQEWYSSKDKQLGPFNLSPDATTSSERNAPVLQLPRVSSSSVELSQGILFGIFTEVASLPMKPTTPASKPDDVEPNQGYTKGSRKGDSTPAPIQAGGEFLDSKGSMVEAKRKHSKSTRHHQRSNSPSSSLSDSSDAYESATNSPSKSKVTVEGERCNLPCCCKRQVKKVEKKYSALIDSSQCVKMLIQEHTEELKAVKIQLGNSETHNQELQCRIAEYQRDYDSKVKNMESELENEKAKVQLLQRVLVTEETEKKEERKDNSLTQNELEEKVKNERAKKEILREEKEDERRLRIKYQLEYIDANRKKQYGHKTPRQLDSHPGVRCQDEDSGANTRQSGIFNPPISQNTSSTNFEKQVQTHEQDSSLSSTFDAMRETGNDQSQPPWLSTTTSNS